MKPADLHKVWSAPDNTRLTGKQYSFRLPVHVAAKINALCDIYPSKTKTQLVSDLLAAALGGVIATLPAQQGRALSADGDGKKGYEAEGTIEEFRVLANKHFKELERELGNKGAPDLYPFKFAISGDRS